MKRVKFVGLDVHAETIAVAVAEQDGEVRSLGVLPNREDAVRKLVRKLGPVEQLRFCYEAGPTGYALYWQLTKMGAPCVVVAPTLVPVKAGDRVKTDRRDALKLARNAKHTGGSVGSGRGAHEGESSMPLSGRSENPTRACSPRQLPTDHDYAVPTREYQSDQSPRQLPRPQLAPLPEC